jgi:multiple sugar transport system permease protein
MKKKTRKRATNWYHILLMLGVIMMLFPFLWMLLSSFKTEQEILAVPPSIFPRDFTWNNFVSVTTRIPIFRYFLNSVLVSTVSTIFVLITSAFAGTVFAKYDFPFRNTLFMIILGTTMIPFECYMIPFYLMVSKAGFINSYTGIIAPLVVSSFGIFLMRQQVGSVPNELMDAARIDGCSEFGIFLNVVLPLTKSALAALAIFSFMFGWAFFVWPLIITNSSDLFVLEVGLTMFQNSYTVEYGPVMAGTAISVVPLIIVFMFFRRHIISGMAMSGIKG